MPHRALRRALVRRLRTGTAGWSGLGGRLARAEGEASSSWVAKKMSRARRAIMPRLALSPVCCSSRARWRSSRATRDSGSRTLTMVDASPGGRPTRRCGAGAAWTGGASWGCTTTTRRFAGGIRFSSVERVIFYILPHKLLLWYKIFIGLALHFALVQDFPSCKFSGDSLSLRSSLLGKPQLL